MTSYFDPKTGRQVELINLAEERLKRAADPFKPSDTRKDKPLDRATRYLPQRDYGDESDTVDGTRDGV